MTHWRIEASFDHLYGPVDWFVGHEPKRDVYKRVADALMSKGVQWVKVYADGELHQTITVQGKMRTDETQDATFRNAWEAFKQIDPEASRQLSEKIHGQNPNA